MIAKSPFERVPKHHLKRFLEYTEEVIRGVTDVLVSLDVEKNQMQILVQKEVLAYLYSQKREIEMAIAMKSKKEEKHE